MARIRTVKPEFWTDEKVVECSIPARLLFIGLFNFANDKGCMERSPRRIKMQVFPADTIDCEPLIMELITHGLLTEYSVNGSDYLQIRGFCKHQKINRPSASKIPDPEVVKPEKSEGNKESSMNSGAVNDGYSLPAHGGLTDDSLTDTDTDTEGKGIKSECIAREEPEESSVPAEEPDVYQEPIGLIPITATWLPSPDFSRRAATWGRNVGDAPGYTTAELNQFRDYWKPTNKVRHHSQWEQAFATSLCKQRQGKPQQTDPAHGVSQPMKHIPEGFVG